MHGCMQTYIQTYMAVSILFRPKNRVRAKIFRTFRESFSNFSPSRKFFRRPKFFSIFSWQRCDSFGPKIVKIGAILTVFRPFEISRKFVPYKLLQNFLCGYKIEMAIHFCTKKIHETNFSKIVFVTFTIFLHVVAFLSNFYPNTGYSGSHFGLRSV